MKLLLKKEQFIDRRTLRSYYSAFRKRILASKNIISCGGVLDEDVILQSIKIYAPNDEDEKVIKLLQMLMLMNRSKTYYTS